jgi:hypothetical protein
MKQAVQVHFLVSSDTNSIITHKQEYSFTLQNDETLNLDSVTGVATDKEAWVPCCFVKSAKLSKDSWKHPKKILIHNWISLAQSHKCAQANHGKHISSHHKIRLQSTRSINFHTDVCTWNVNMLNCSIYTRKAASCVSKFQPLSLTTSLCK